MDKIDIKNFPKSKFKSFFVVFFILFLWFGMTDKADAWYSSSWLYRKAITIDHTKVSQVSSTTLTNFPVLVSLPSDANLASYAQSNGNDILFTSSDGSTKLNHEIETYASTTGQLVAWVNVASLSPTADTVIYVYFGNPGASNQQNVAGVWDSGYRGVYHLPDGTVLSANDSTVNANNGVPFIGTCGGSCSPNTATTGKISGGVLFPTPYSEPIVIASSTSLNLTSSLTMETWFNTSTLPSSWNSMSFIWGDSGSSTISYLLGLTSNNVANTVYLQAETKIGGTDYPAYNAGYATTTLATNTWYHLVGTYDGTNWRIYLNGDLVSTVASSVAPSALTNQVDLGSGSASGQISFTPSWNVYMDEARISGISRSADWIKTEYNDENSPSTFYSLGTLENFSGPPTISSFSANPSSIGTGATTTLSWTVVGATALSIDQGIGSVTGNSTTTPVLSTTTTFTLTATNTYGTSTSTAVVSVDNTPPSIPTGLTAGTMTSSTTPLSWTASTDNVAVTGYDIFRGLTSGNLSQIATTSVTSYTDVGLNSSTNYYYAVKAYDAGGNVSATSSVISVTTAAAAGTTINVSSSVQTSGIKRFGINLGSTNFYDSGQMLKNLINRNPGFEGQNYQTIFPCNVSSGANDCQDATNGSNTSYSYDTYPTDFWAGATYEVISGQAKGRTGTVTVSNNTGAAAPTDLTLSAGSPAIAVGDIVVVRKTVNDVALMPTVNLPAGDPVEGWWMNDYTGTATTSVDVTDIATSSLGTQALHVNAAGAGNQLSLTAYFDTLGGPEPFVKLNGTYKLSFKAKNLGTANTINVDVGRNTTGNPQYLNQNIDISANTWQDYSVTFTANEDGSLVGSAYVKFYIGNIDMYIDDVSLVKISGTDPTNTTEFSDDTVSALQELQPGIIRDWNGQLGDTLDNEIMPLSARKSAHYSVGYGSTGSVGIGLIDLLQISQKIGAEPWYVIPANWSTQDMTNLMEYLGGASTTPYGAKRAAQGQVAPWTSVFSKIHLEFGNENWNTGFSGGIINNLAAYGQRGDQMFATAKASPYYSSSNFQMILGAQYAVSTTASTINSNSTHHDAIAEAPYFGYDVNSNVAGNNESLYGQLFSEIEFDSHGTGGTQKDNVSASSPVPIAVYEENISTIQGSITQTQLNTLVPSLGAGLALGNHMLMQLRDLGITDQNVFALPQYGFSSNYNGTNEQALMWGIVLDMGVTNRRRPQFLAEQLANTTIATSTDELVTTQGGDNPTWTQSIDYYGSTIPSVTSHYIQAYAFSNHNLILLNLSRTNSLTVHLTGSPLPTGSVTVKQLTSANITDNNESANTVQITSQSYSNFDPNQTIVLPPYSMTAYIQDGTTLPDTSAPTSPTGLTSSVVSSSAVNLSWTASTDNVGVIGYKIYRDSNQIGTTRSLTYADSSLSPSTTYSYTVSAYDAAGNVSAQSATSSATTLAVSSGVGGSVGSGGGGGATGGTASSLSVSNFQAIPFDGGINLTWNKPADSSFVQVMIVRKLGSMPTSSTDGTVVYEGPLTNYTDTNLTNGITYYYAAFSVTTSGLNSTAIATIFGTPIASGTQVSPTNNSTISSTITASPASGIFLTHVLSIGSTGSDVTLLQHFLIANGYITEIQTPTGYFGKVTEDGLKKFQCDNDVVCSGTPDSTGYGIVGLKTMAKLSSFGGQKINTITSVLTQPITQNVSNIFTRTLAIGMSGSDVENLQKLLIDKNYLAKDTSPLGFFGMKTRKALMKFQCDQGIVCDGFENSTGFGVMGPKTRTVINTELETTSTSTTNQSSTSQMMETISSLLKEVQTLETELNSIKGVKN